MTVLPDGRVLLNAGSYEGYGGCEQVGSDVAGTYFFDPVTMQTTAGPPNPLWSLRPVAFDAADGRVVVAGVDNMSLGPGKATEILDLATQSWQIGPDLPVAGAQLFSSPLPSGRTLVLYGQTAVIYDAGTTSTAASSSSATTVASASSTVKSTAVGVGGGSTATSTVGVSAARRRLPRPSASAAHPRQRLRRSGRRRRLDGDELGGLGWGVDHCVELDDHRAELERVGRDDGIEHRERGRRRRRRRRRRGRRRRMLDRRRARVRVARRDRRARARRPRSTQAAGAALMIASSCFNDGRSCPDSCASSRSLPHVQGGRPCCSLLLLCGFAALVRLRLKTARPWHRRAARVRRLTETKSARGFVRTVRAAFAERPKSAAALPAAAATITRRGDALSVERAAGATAEVELAAQASGGFSIVDVATGVGARVRLRGASNAPAELADGYVFFRDAAGAGTALLHRSSARGNEDYVYLPSAPARAELRYDVDLGEGVTGVRLMEAVGRARTRRASGAPRLRASAPPSPGTMRRAESASR